MTTDRYYEVTIKGTTPIMFYNPRLSDPLDPYAKELRKATKKGVQRSEEDHLNCSRIESQGAMHFHDGEDGRPKMGPYIPSEMLEAVLKNAAQRGLGKKFGLFVRGDDPLGFPLLYEGPRTRDGLWKAREQFVDRRSCSTNGKTRVMRSRPIFRHWSCKFTLIVLDAQLDEDQVKDAVENAGIRGMGSYHKRFGRFALESFKDVTRQKTKAA